MGETIDLLGRCLSFDLPLQELSALRLRLMREAELWGELIVAAEDHGMTMALVDRLEAHGLLTPFRAGAQPQRVNPAALLRASRGKHLARRTRLAKHLRDVVAQLNAIGVEPQLLKGAQSLWTGEPAWRYLRDIDLLVPPDQAEAAQQALLASGHHPFPGRRERPSRHHLAGLFHDDLPGWVEIHRRGGNIYCERLLPTATLERASGPSADEAGRVRLLPRPVHVLHAMVHHHVGHSAYARGTLSFKGLYEFAWDIATMSDAERVALAALAGENPRLSAMLDLWTAAAGQVFAMPVRPPPRIVADARARWERIRVRAETGSRWKYPGYGDEIGMALSDARVRSAPGGSSWPGRQRLRAGVLAAMLPRLRP